MLVYFVGITVRTNRSALISHASLSSKEIELSIPMQTLCDVSGVKDNYVFCSTNPHIH